MQFRCAVPVCGGGGVGVGGMARAGFGIFFYCLSLFPCVRVSQWTKACHFGQVCWLTSKLWPLRLGLQTCAAMLSLVPECWAFEPGSSCLHNHCSIQSASHLPSPLGSDGKTIFQVVLFYDRIVNFLSFNIFFKTPHCFLKFQNLKWQVFHVKGKTVGFSLFFRFISIIQLEPQTAILPGRSK